MPGTFDPNILPDRLSILSSMIVWTSKDLVLEEKFIFNLRYYSYGRDYKYDEIITDLAVPESPTNKTGCLLCNIIDNK